MRKSKTIKRISCILLGLLIVVTASPVTVFAAEQPTFEIQSQSVYLKNINTGTVIYAQNEHEKMYPASLTKIMTAIVTLENVSNLEKEMASYELYMQDQLYGKNAQLGGINLGEKISIRGLLYASLLRSANEAALMLADYVGGSQEGFIEMMNQKATELGMTQTHYSTPNGLHDDQNYTTAYDQALLCEYAMKNEIFREIVSQYYVNIGPTSMREDLWEQSTNSMLLSTSSYYYAPIEGIKTGTTDEAGRCFASQATKNGYTYICIQLGAPYYNEDGSVTDMITFQEAKKLYEWAFNSFSIQNIIEKDEILTECNVRLSSETDHVQLIASNEFQFLLSNEYNMDDIEYVYEKPESINAPIEAGTEVGTVKIYCRNELLGTVPLKTGYSVKASAFLVFFDHVRLFFGLTIVKIVIALIVLGFGLLLYNRIRQRKIAERKKRRREQLEQQRKSGR